MDKKLYPELQNYSEQLASNFAIIDEERKIKLKEIGDYIIEKKREQKTASNNVNVTVICTHNSRRSHFGQVWLQVAAAYYGIEGINTFSGGTETTAFNTRAVAALEQAGVKIEKTTAFDGDENPVYSMSVGKKYSKTLMFSKKYTHKQNPQKGFAAIMVCSDADKNCPLVMGADARFAIPFEDPKSSDNTPSEEQTYNERCKQIGTEFFFVMDYVKTELSKE
ncbi:protein-tyrosine-phosphatase [Bernardetia litoralis DSM 6794]|uniref:Protein-tyrosine-phosphatase n=1 Tax=Bernardetia litoralis (strain ATCC 23117 / DSM 6794 / NBRC 15988 / NCIMB 1366 / Fx l1 / Sio-4) TaxID=880071 RepID=I4AMC4_BERLS|nr:arsenate reductase [Bernardetia litoralis]AFM05109.1 protein-tyrosine-phosphatase [Bernardetia litoralis DSM 6794]